MLEAGFHAPGWRDFVSEHALRPEHNNMDEKPGPRRGWQDISSMSWGRTVRQHQFVVQFRALFRLPFISFTTAGSTLSRFACFFAASGSLLLHCAYLPGLPLDRLLCHHRAACCGGGSGTSGFRSESAATRVVLRPGAIVSVNIRVQDMDLALPDALDNRCLEKVGLSCIRVHNWLWTAHSCQS